MAYFREAKSNRFLPARQPSEFQGRGGNGKKARRQRHMEAGLERERREKAAGVRLVYYMYHPLWLY